MADKLITTQNDRTNAPQTSFYSTNDRTVEDQYQQEAKVSADQAKLYRGQAEDARDAAQESEAAAKQSEDASAVNANIAQTAQDAADDASTSAGQASASEQKARAWADEPEDSAVESGAFSAKHHAIKAEGSSALSGTYRDEAEDSATAAAASASNAADSESNAATSESNAGSSASNASASEGKAQQWADANEDVEVESGKYSAKHWATKAEQITSGARSYQGTHDASGGNYPIASPSTGDEGKYWVVSNGGPLPAGAVAPGDELSINPSLNYEIISLSSVYAQRINNLSDLDSATAARSNLGLGSAATANISAFGITLIDDSDAATARGTLGLGSASQFNVGTTANQIPQRNASGQVPGDITGSASTASTADRLSNARNITLSGDVSGSVGFDGSSDAEITVNVNNDSHLHSLTTISDAGTAASRDVGAGTSAVPDNSQLNTRLGTTGNLGSMATKADSDYLSKSEFDSTAPRLVWSGSSTDVSISSLSEQGTGFYIVTAGGGGDRYLIFVEGPNVTSYGTTRTSLPGFVYTSYESVFVGNTFRISTYNIDNGTGKLAITAIHKV